MVLIIRLVPNQRCAGCAAHGHVEDKTLLCLSCFDVKVRIEERKRKLVSTMAQRFAFFRGS
jgi:hypothetical protein